LRMSCKNRMSIVLLGVVGLRARAGV
jgi:hypothetical protein